MKHIYNIIALFVAYICIMLFVCCIFEGADVVHFYILLYSSTRVATTLQLWLLVRLNIFMVPGAWKDSSMQTLCMLKKQTVHCITLWSHQENFLHALYQINFLQSQTANNKMADGTDS